MLMIVQPFDNEKIEANQNFTSNLIGCILALIAAFSSSLTLVYTSRLAKHKVHWSVISLYMMVGQSLIAPIWSQINLTTQKIDTIPVYDNGYIYLACIGLSVLATI